MLSGDLSVYAQLAFPVVGTILVHGVPWALLQQLRHELTFSNPAFASASARGEDVSKIPPQIYAYRETVVDGTPALHVPRYYWNPVLEQYGYRVPIPPEAGDFEHQVQTGPREYQQPVFELLQNIDCDVGLQLTCGYGKTYLALAYAAKFKGRILVVAPTEVKLNEWFAEITQHLGYPRKLIGHVQASIRKWKEFPVSVTMLKTLATQKFPSEFCNGFAVVILDECIAEGTQIRMADGTDRPIEEVCPGSLVATPLGPRRVLAARDSGRKLCLQITTSSGKMLSITPDHPVAMVERARAEWRSGASGRTADCGALLRLRTGHDEAGSGQACTHKEAAGDHSALRNAANGGCVPDPIRSIEAVGIRRVYDLQVEGAECFFANELLVHNCHLASAPIMSHGLGVVGGRQIQLSATPGSGVRRELLRLHGGNNWIIDAAPQRPVTCYMVRVTVPQTTAWAKIDDYGFASGGEKPWRIQQLILSKDRHYAEVAGALIRNAIDDGRRVLVLNKVIAPLVRIYRQKFPNAGFVVGAASLREIVEEVAPQLKAVFETYPGNGWAGKAAHYVKLVKKEANPILGTGLTKTQPVGTGMDVPDLDAGIIMFPVADADMTQQIVGRFRRDHPTKKDPTLIVMVPSTRAGISIGNRMSGVLKGLGINVVHHEATV